ncbi:MAG: TonB-dependent receptor, partial [Sphingomonadales bacterium]
LEDSGAAPENAANRNAQLPATRSTQYEGGVRWRFAGGQMVVNAFEISKPYFAFDAANVFSEIGKVRHRGIEASLSGTFFQRLSLVAGATAIQARVSGLARDTGLVGKRPTGVPSSYARLDANYRTDIFGGLTPTATVTYTGKRAVGARPLAVLGGSQLSLPGSTIVDIGLRQVFKIGNTPASFRAVVNNVFDKQTWRVVAPNTLYIEERSRFMLVLTADL